VGAEHQGCAGAAGGRVEHLRGAAAEAAAADAGRPRRVAPGGQEEGTGGGRHPGLAGESTMATRRPIQRERTRGPKLEPHQVILRPLVTEKGTHQFTHRNAYPFEVNLWATKDEIRAAVQELFGVRVRKVRTQQRLGKKRRYRSRVGQLPRWKKAIVTLHEE